MLVDCHCHLDFPQFDGDRDEVVERAKDLLIVNSTVDPGLAEKGLGLAARYPNVRCMLGFSASELDEEKFRLMMELIAENRKLIIGVGEAGLDYYWVKDGPGRAKERDHFIKVVDLSRELALPLLVHSRGAESDCINILRERKVAAIMHCFSGTLEEALEAVESGCLISIPANVTVSKARQRLARELPLESLVLETDAPFLAPERGARCEPADVIKGCEKVAELKGVSFEEAASATSENALRFLKIKT